jgi:hypothetical protein
MLEICAKFLCSMLKDLRIFLLLSFCFLLVGAFLLTELRIFYHNLQENGAYDSSP